MKIWREWSVQNLDIKRTRWYFLGKRKLRARRFYLILFRMDIWVKVTRTRYGDNKGMTRNHRLVIGNEPCINIFFTACLHNSLIYFCRPTYYSGGYLAQMKILMRGMSIWWWCLAWSWIAGGEWIMKKKFQRLIFIFISCQSEKIEMQWNGLLDLD